MLGKDNQLSFIVMLIGFSFFVTLLGNRPRRVLNTFLFWHLAFNGTN